MKSEENKRMEEMELTEDALEQANGGADLCPAEDTALKDTGMTALIPIP